MSLNERRSGGPDDCAQTEIRRVLRLVAARYMEDQPARPFACRAYRQGAFRRTGDGRSDLDFSARFPDAPMGAYAYAFSMLWSREEGEMCLAVSCKCPAWIYINGELVRQTQNADEYLRERDSFCFPVREGYNSVFVKVQKNVLGFACQLGCYNPKWLPVNFYTAFSEGAGSLGWHYTGFCVEDTEEIPALNAPRPPQWLPEPEGNTWREVLADADCGTAVTEFIIDRAEAELTLRGSAERPVHIWVDGRELFSGQGEIAVPFRAGYGTHRVAVSGPGGQEVLLRAEGLAWRAPGGVQGGGPWLYADGGDPAARRGFTGWRLLRGEKGPTFWRCGRNTYVRPVLEHEIYGKSSYPIGVALYGLLDAARLLEDREIYGYAAGHLRLCSGVHPYALWDAERFGFACVNHQLLTMSSLDDCGAFGAALLECDPEGEDVEVRALADRIAAYIRHGQERLENGMLYRSGREAWCPNTVWADDLYMSVPFLIRYDRLRGGSGGLDDAAEQFAAFKEKLWMPEKQIMSHVYNLDYQLPTGVPWGRGNGWVLFSLSEILAVCPKIHPRYEFLLQFFRELSQGILRLQDGEGLWHQVLTDPTSYQETSCTSMFVCAMARGVRHGWLEGRPWADAACRGWAAVCRRMIDSKGNIYCVCQGSGYSFREAYYRNELGWNTNDTHGTGIVLLAGAAVARMLESNKEGGNNAEAL